MNDLREILRLAWRNLFRNRRRTLASLLTVGFGAAGLLIYQGFNEGIMNQYRENTIRVRYGHGEVFAKGYLDKKVEDPWTLWLSAPEAVEARLRAIPGVRDVFPRVSFYAFLVKGGITLAGRGEGVRPEREAKFFSAMNFTAGGDLATVSDAGGAVIIGQGLAASLGVKPGDPVTALVQTAAGQLNGADLRVAGVFHTGSKEFDDSYFRVDLKTAQTLLDTPKVELFSLATDGVEAWPSVSASIAAAMPELDARPFDELDAVYYKNAVRFLEAQFGFIRAILLLIVALGIFNSIATGLIERSGEVGALRANGEPRRRLVLTMLAESAYLGLLGGAFGILFAVLLDKTVLASGIPMPPGPGITRQFLIFLEIQPRHFQQALFGPAVATVLASILPILKLARASIPELLRRNL